MLEDLKKLLSEVVVSLQQSDVLPEDFEPRFTVERTRDPAHGDLATNLALVSAKKAGKNPREMADIILTQLQDAPFIKETNIAGPGFINFFLSSESTTAVINQALSEGDSFGTSDIGQQQKVIVEFVSANPTGPLHIGHGRGAAYGATLSNLLTAAGWDVHREYYVNDAGRQMHILAVSVLLRYLELSGQSINFPVNGYKGGYIRDIAATLHQSYPTTFQVSLDDLYDNVVKDVVLDEDGNIDESAGGDKEKHVDDLITNAKSLLADDYHTLFTTTLESIRSEIQQDLEEFGVQYDEWFSEQSLTDSGDIADAIKRLTAMGHMYEKDGAIWFKATAFGDDKDRVVVRDNGQTTYFASDISYHMNKLDRGFDRVIDVFGADHHGYVTRVKASMKALGANPDQLDVPLVQFAILYRGGERVQMSTRSGSFVTLRELREEVGNDACRFFYVMRKAEQHMDFDLDLAKSQSNENPMYYIQYAHARIASLFRRLSEAGYEWDQETGLAALDHLTTEHELALIKRLSAYPDLIKSAAKTLEPHSIAHYLRDLANDFHSYYNAEKLILDDDKIRNARFCLARATKQTLKNGLAILGVSAPEEM